MANGDYNQEWCKERHQKMDERMDKLETKFWWIITLLLINLGGVLVMLLEKVS